MLRGVQNAELPMRRGSESATRGGHQFRRSRGRWRAAKAKAVEEERIRERERQERDIKGKGHSVSVCFWCPEISVL